MAKAALIVVGVLIVVMSFMGGYVLSGRYYKQKTRPPGVQLAVSDAPQLLVEAIHVKYPDVRATEIKQLILVCRRNPVRLYFGAEGFSRDTTGTVIEPGKLIILSPSRMIRTAKVVNANPGAHAILNIEYQ